MNQQPAATAVLQAALRRRLVSVKEALALRHVLAGCGDDPQVVRVRLSHLPGQVSEATTATLLALLPTAGSPDTAPYRRFALLGEGQLGATWLGQGQAGLVTLKYLHAHVLDHSSAIGLQTTLTPLLGAGHRYLVDMLALVPRTEGGWLLVQRYRQGRDASQRADIKGEASEARALTILRHAVKGLVQLHQLGLHHGQLHPGNLLFDQDGRAALSDFALTGPAAAPRLSATRLLRHAFAAPEELSERPTSGPSADLYTLGCIGWWLLTGEPPFPGTPDRQLFQHQGADRPDVRERAPGVSDLTAKTLLKCMQIDPQARYRDARALLHSLERNLDLLERPQQDTEPVAKPVARQGASPLLVNGLGYGENHR